MIPKFRYYKLNGKIPVPVNQEELASVFEQDRTVAKTVVAEGVEVSTVFLVIDHSFGGGAPLLFETLVFGGELDGEMTRYGTWEDAEAGHWKMVGKVKKSIVSELISFPNPKFKKSE